jgi:hypothetical protein
VYRNSDRGADGRGWCADLGLRQSRAAFSSGSCMQRSEESWSCWCSPWEERQIWRSWALRPELAVLRRQVKCVDAGNWIGTHAPTLPHTRESIRRGRRAYALAQAIREEATEGAQELEAACRVPDRADDRRNARHRFAGPTRGGVADDEHPVEALTLERADEPIGDCVGLGTLIGVRTIRSPLRTEDLVEGGRVLRVQVAD